MTRMKMNGNDANANEVARKYSIKQTSNNVREYRKNIFATNKKSNNTNVTTCYNKIFFKQVPST